MSVSQGQALYTNRTHAHNSSVHKYLKDPLYYFMQKCHDTLTANLELCRNEVEGHTYTEVGEVQEG